MAAGRVGRQRHRRRRPTRRPRRRRARPRHSRPDRDLARLARAAGGDALGGPADRAAAADAARKAAAHAAHAGGDVPGRAGPRVPDASRTPVAGGRLRRPGPARHRGQPADSSTDARAGRHAVTTSTCSAPGLRTREHGRRRAVDAARRRRRPRPTWDSRGFTPAHDVRRAAPAGRRSSSADGDGGRERSPAGPSTASDASADGRQPARARVSRSRRRRRAHQRRVRLQGQPARAHHAQLRRRLQAATSTGPQRARPRGRASRSPPARATTRSTARCSVARTPTAPGTRRQRHPTGLQRSRLLERRRLAGPARRADGLLDRHRRQRVRHRHRLRRQGPAHASSTTATASHDLRSYDPLTFRLARLRTRARRRSALQDLRYTYDPVGNITRIADARAADRSSSATAASTPARDYTLRRAVPAGRGQRAASTSASWRRPAAEPGDDATARRADPSRRRRRRWRRYIERYGYDAVGNILRDGAPPGQRPGAAGHGVEPRYQYALDEQPPARQPAAGSTDRSATRAAGRRYTYDAHGNMTAMPHLPLMRGTTSTSSRRAQVVNTARRRRPTTSTTPPASGCAR